MWTKKCHKGRNAYKRHNKYWPFNRAVSVMACIVVFCTTYALILPAITMEGKQIQSDIQVDDVESEATGYKLEADGADYSVVVRFGKEAAIPEGTKLSVRELESGTKEYQNHYDETVQMLPEEYRLFFCRFFDISFVYDGTEIEPEAAVDVQISYKDEIPVELADECKAVHFAETGTEVLDAHFEVDSNGSNAFAFTQDSFSVVGTTVSSLNLSDGSYIFYKDGYAIGANSYGLREIKVTVDDNGYVYPSKSTVDIDRITWTYNSGRLKNKYTNTYLYLTSSNATTSSTSQYIDARIIGNVVRFSYNTGSYDYNYNLINYYLGFETDSGYTASTLFADGDYFTAAKVETVDDSVVSEGDLEISDTVKTDGRLIPKLNSTISGVPTYKWYKSYDGGSTWQEVNRVKVTSSLYNAAADGSWVNVALDKGADALYKVQLTHIDGVQQPTTIEARPYKIPYYDSIQNGDFENPAISTDVSNAEHYQPFLPNGTAGMVWKTTASDGQVEYVSVASPTFKNMSYMWHNCNSAAKGVQFVELNANMPGALYQDVLTMPGSTMYWSLAHRGRGTTSMRDGSDYAEDTMYVVIMSTALAEQYNVTTQDAVNDVISNPTKYKGVQIVEITDDNWQWYYHNGDYTVPAEQYLTRYFFVAGPTSFDAYGGDITVTPQTVGNHLDDIYFSTELPPPDEGKANLTIRKTITGMKEEDAENLLKQLKFSINSTDIYGTEMTDFSYDGEGGYTAIYQLQLNLGTSESILVTVSEDVNTTAYDGYRYQGIKTNIDGGTANTNSSVTIRIAEQTSRTVAFTNEYEQLKGNITIKKTDESGNALSGAVFALYVSDGETLTAVNEDIAVNETGQAYLSNIELDKLYCLKEIVAPNGYYKIEEPVYFKLVYEANAIKAKRCDASGNFISSWPGELMVVDGADNLSIIFEVKNKSGFVLPETGGKGTGGYIVVGMILLSCYVVLSGYRVRHRLERRENSRRSSPNR